MSTVVPIGLPLLISGFMLLSSFQPASAQLNESDTARFQVRTALTGAWQNGNVEVKVIRGKLDWVSNSSKNIVFKSQNNSLYQTFGGYKADNDINSRNYLYFRSLKKYYPFTMVYVQTNFRRKISLRIVGGLGYTWQIIQLSHTLLKLSGSVVLENTKFKSSQFNQPIFNGRDVISLSRGTVYLAGWHRLATQKIRLVFSGYWQPGFDKIPNNRTALDFGVEIPVWKSFGATAQYTYTFEQVVPSKILQEDQILTLGISYQLRKL